MIPLHWVTPGSAGPFAHESFYDCWNAPKEKNGLKAWMTANGKGGIKDIDAAIDFFGKIEEELGDCAGACATPLFGVKAKISNGPVTLECVEIIIETLDTLLGPGIVCLLTFFVLLAACCGSITLCRGFNEDDLEQG